ncbi:uncharacterized protein LOC107267659 isoform X2 [Cephus cinctus]|uniref:Uncharacterized protein LOC107267659 isoform X2 n=1 Tax=Cephus cinctus TaxID=211228 RepID=A0AAJ7BV90_CEPCN|nr:uncharacterized protein LOC107267659 isoform X2 [Cephus cinctus]
MVATASGTVQTLFDFTRSDQLTNWTENSDTIKSTGMSKAILVLQKTQVFQRAILFTLFNPQPNGSGFAAVRCETTFNLSDFNNIILKCRGQGMNVKYKMLLRHKGLGKDSAVYGQIFTTHQPLLTSASRSTMDRICQKINQEWQRWKLTGSKLLSDLQ